MVSLVPDVCIEGKIKASFHNHFKRFADSSSYNADYFPVIFNILYIVTHIIQKVL